MAAQCFVCAQLLSRLFATSWTLAHQAPLFMGLSQQEYWSGLPFPPPGNLPNPGTEPVSLKSPALVGGFFTTNFIPEAQGDVHVCVILVAPR